MKKWLFILVLLNATVLWGQEVVPCPEFARIMRDAEKAEKAGDFRSAILRYNAAERCNPAKAVEIGDRVLRVFEKIDQLRIRAEAAQRSAEREKRIAEAEAQKAKIAEQQAKTAEKQAKLAEKRAEEQRDIAQQNFETMVQEKTRADQEAFRANRKSIESKSSALAAKAQRLQWENPTLAVKLADAAYQMLPDDGDDARGTVDDILSDPEAVFYYKEILIGRPVTAFALAPDGSVFVSGDDLGNCTIWDKDGKKLHDFKAHDAQVKKLAFSPDGKYFISSGWDDMVHFWNPDGSLIRSMAKQNARIQDFAISSKEDRLAICLENSNIIQIWGNKGKMIHEFIGHDKAIEALAFSPDGDFLVSGDKDGVAILWNMLGAVLKKYESKEGGISCIAFSPNAREICLTTRFPEIWRFLEDEQLVFSSKTISMSNLAFSTDGRMLATNDMLEPSTTIWWANGTKYRTLNGHAPRTTTTNIAFAPDNRTIITAGEDGSIKFWDLYANVQSVLSGHKAYISSVAFSPDGTKIATASADGTAKLWTLEGQELQTLAAHTDQVNDIAFSPDGNIILTGSDDHSAILWNLEGKVVRTLQGHTGTVNAVAFSSTGKWLLTASADSTARVWDFEGKLLYTYRGHKAALSSIRMMPEGDAILTSGWDGTIRIWSIGGVEQRVLHPNSVGIKSASVSIDGKIAAVIDDETVVVWDPQGQEILRLNKLPYAVLTVSFSVDGQTLITSSFSDDNVSLWDLKGRKIASLRDQNGFGRGIACSPDGNYLLVSGGPYDDGTAKTASLWLMPSAWLRYGIAPMQEEDIISYGIRDYLQDYEK